MQGQARPQNLAPKAFRLVQVRNAQVTHRLIDMRIEEKQSERGGIYVLDCQKQSVDPKLWFLDCFASPAGHFTGCEQPVHNRCLAV